MDSQWSLNGGVNGGCCQGGLMPHNTGEKHRKVGWEQTEHSTASKTPLGVRLAADADDGGVIYIPMINQTIRRNRIVEVPEVHVIEKYVPKVTFQDVIRKVPRTEIQWVEKIVEVPQVKVRRTQLRITCVMLK